ncbi:DsbA family oxidoreductase [Patulibacter brassicae]|jgi:predicted DsbA family dithiol-disulfide isomerase|uniref:DsbA family oxidoreductase n=1 Tax=Patulibacter brassicae TaxID=1705717 RepID=A0ABU4VLG2_9ACTN|nr:DsbA family oxidoreductase [Patulibacter brassicae]MDX8151771.1 DsbA family oxidoreductase [Patulibacter brassicae]
MKVEIWSDVACPFCFIGKRSFEDALERFEHRDDVEVTWRSFQLDPSAPPSSDHGLDELLARKYGRTIEQARQMNDQVTQMAAGVGLEYHLDRARPGNTFDAHRLIHLGRAHGIADAVKERLLRAYFTEGELLSDHETLVRLGAEAGLDADEARDALASDRFAAAVREELVEAHDLGLQGVPAFVFDRRSQVTGAQPADLFLQALERAWATSAA